MRGTSDQLLRLTATLSGQEKRYFKLYTSFYNKKDGNHCLRLFELIERHKPANSTALAALAHGEPYAAHLAYIKNQLTEQILDCLASYNAEKRTATALYRLVAHIDLLIERGLYRHAARVLARAQKKAEETEQYPLLLELTARERSLLFHQVSRTFEDDLRTLYTRRQSILEAIRLIDLYRDAMDSMQITAARYAATPTEHDRAAMERIVSTLGVHHGQPLPFSARSALHSIRGSYALLADRTDEALTQYRDAVHLWRAHPHMIADYPVQYLRYLQNYLNCLLAGDNEEEFAATAAEFRQRATADSDTQFRFLKELWNIELLFYMNRGTIELCAATIADIDQYLDTHGEHIEQTSFLTLCHNCSVYTMLTGAYAQCLKYINLIRDNPQIEFKRDLLCFSRVFSLVIHFELGNYDILDMLMLSARRYMKKLGEAGVVEQILLRHMRALTDSAGGPGERAAFSALRSRLVDVLHTSAHEPLGISAVLFWVESRLRRQSIHRVFDEMVRCAGGVHSRLLFPRDKTPANDTRARRRSRNQV